MTQTEISQAAEKYATSEYAIPIVHQAATLDFITGAIIALTHGWNNPDVVPEVDRCLLVIWNAHSEDNEKYTDGAYFGKDKAFYFHNGDIISNVLAWRYDNAKDIYELLKENGTI
jgi:hypothetical protein